MLSSSEYSRFSSHQSESPGEKSKFSQTCSLWSQYLKEPRNYFHVGNNNYILFFLGSPETSQHSAATMEFSTTSKSLTAMDFLSLQNVYQRQSSEVPTIVKSRSVEKEPKPAQLTIFYAGQVAVFDDVPADKVKEIVSLASKGIPQSQNSSEHAHTHNHPSIVPNTIIPQPPPTPILSDIMPIARKHSLHRFLAKRKDRIVAKAPYQTKNPNSAPNKPAG